MLGGRKCIITGAALAMAFTLALLGKLTADFASVVSICVATFHGAHMVQDWKTRSE